LYDLKEIFITDIAGIKVGNAQDEKGATGCTVVLCEEGACGGVDVRGGAPATRETDLLHPINMVEKIHAVILSGGSAFGLDAASGVMAYLEEQGRGVIFADQTVPIVCGASLFDLLLGEGKVRPDKAMGYQAASAAFSAPVTEGNVGAGTGASVGKALGMSRAMKTGLGSFGLQVGDLQVAALVAVNALGDIIEEKSGRKLAGFLNAEKSAIADTEGFFLSPELPIKKIEKEAQGNTVIGVIVTNGAFNKAETSKIAMMAQDGLARVIRPAHTMYDGDTVFALATGACAADVNVAGFLAARVMAEAICRGVRASAPAYGLPAYENFYKDK